MILYVFLAAVAVMLVSLSGIVFAFKATGGLTSKYMRFLITFAFGIFIITTIRLISESLELAPSLLLVIVGMLVGILLLEFGTRIIPHAHHHHHGSDEEHHTHSPLDARRILLNDAIHNIGDGILLVPAFLVSVHVGIVVTIGIVVHELVQEIAEFFIIKEAGYSTKEALMKNFLVSSTILIGVVISLFLSQDEALVGPLLAVASGGFLYIIFRDLLPSIIVSVKNQKHYFGHGLAFLLGLAVMYGASALAPHEHVHENDHEDDHGHEEHMEEHHV